MTQKILLIDFENVQQVDISRIADTTKIIIFVGASQKAVPIKLVTAAQMLGERVEWQQIEGNGKNALDFHIACHLGRVLERTPQHHCVVLSKDKGFDPLIRQLNKVGLKCRRINSLLELEPEFIPVDETSYKRVVEVLGKSDNKSRPRKLMTLSQHISSIFQKKIPQKDIDRIIGMLIENKMITETNNTISYGF